MNTEFRSEPAMSQLAEDAGEMARDSLDAVKAVTGDVKKSAGDLQRLVARKSSMSLEASKECVRRHPVPVILGAIAFGAAIGSLLIMARRKPTFGERYADAPLAAMREALLGALSPVTQRVHSGMDTVRESAEKAINHTHLTGQSREGGSFSDQIGRIGHNLKFW